MSEFWSWLNPRTTLQLGRDWIRSTHPTLTSEDVKHALGGLSEKPFLFGMAAFLGDPKSLHALECHLIADLMLAADAGEWIRRREHFEIVQRMGALMLFEVIAARARAEGLPGEENGRQLRNVAHVLCPACLGKGTLAPVCLQCEGLRFERSGVLNPNGSPIFKRDGSGKRVACEGCCGLGVTGDRCGFCGGTRRFALTDRRRAEACGLATYQWSRLWSDRYAGHIDTPMRWEFAAIGHVKRRLSGRLSMAS